MTLPIIDTPLPERLQRAEPRTGGWDRALEPAMIKAPGVEALVARLGAPGALAVTTGQQPGLLTGPAYAVSKALSARALARELERRWARPVIPVFWVPGDDHDIDEISRVSWLAADGSLRSGSLPPRAPEAPLTPMYQEPLGAAVLDVLNSFEHGFPDSDIRGETVAWLRRHYRPEATVAGGFGAAMAELLAPLGVLCFDPTHPAAKRAAAPIMLRALTAAGKLDGALVHRAASLEAAGRGSSVAVGDGASLVFLEGPLGRDRLMTDGHGFITRRGRIRYTESELRRIAEEAPTRFSANVLLRAVVESALLPTVAYAAGPAELRYLALAQPVYQEFGIAQQLPVPRWSGLLVEPRVTRILDKFATSVEELAAEGAGLEARLVRQSLPEGTEAAFTALQAAIEQYFAPVARNAAAVDPTLERPVQSARGQALHAAKKLEHKVLRLARKREGVELAQVARARMSLRPEGKPQERVLSMVGFMARYGGGVVDGLATHIEGWYAGALEAGAPTP